MTVTKKDNFNAVIAILEVAKENGIILDEAFGDITLDTLIDFANHEIELLDTKAAAAKGRAQIKKDEGGIFREKVFSLLTSEPQTVPMLTRQLNEDLGPDDLEISPQMVTARLTQLCGAGRVIREVIKVPVNPDGTKLKNMSTYRIA